MPRESDLERDAQAPSSMAASTRAISSLRRAKRLGPRGTLALRTFLMECVGTFVANLFAIAVLFACAANVYDAQGHTLMDTATGPAMPPGVVAVNPVIPDPQGTIPLPTYPGHKGAISTNHLYVVFPTDTLLVAMGIGFAYAMGLTVCPGCALNPTFTVASAIFERGPWYKAASAIVGQMVGGIAACFTMYVAGRGVFQTHGPDGNGESYVLGEFPKSATTASLFGLSLPRESLPFGATFFSSVLFTALMVMVVTPALNSPAGPISLNMQAWVVGLVITPFVLATGPLGVQSNAAMYMSALIFCTLARWPSSLWGAAHGYIVTVLFAPVLGAMLGGFAIAGWGWLLLDPQSPLTWTDESPQDAVDCESSRREMLA
mmetsp:Transcript_129372/g.374648  ORF Transcript_129372/g.374648 Transcript_129372/m.374648 type:complete len:375 (+) Transcript_129372:46-1170(+)